MAERDRGVEETPPGRLELLADLIGPPMVPVVVAGYLGPAQWYSPRHGWKGRAVLGGHLVVSGLTRQSDYDGPWAQVAFASPEAVAASFPDRPWVWASASDSFWASPHPEWVALVDLALDTIGCGGKGQTMDAPWSAIGRPKWALQRLAAGEHFDFEIRGTRRVSAVGAIDMYEIEEYEYDALVLRRAGGGHVELGMASSGDLRVGRLLATAMIVPTDHPAAQNPSASTALVEAIGREVGEAWRVAAHEAEHSLDPVRSRLEPILAAVRRLDGAGLRRLERAYEAVSTRDNTMACVHAEVAALEALSDTELLALSLLDERVADTCCAIADRAIPDPHERGHIQTAVPFCLANLLAAVIAGDRLEATYRDLLLAPLSELTMVSNR